MVRRGPVRGCSCGGVVCPIVIRIRRKRPSVPAKTPAELDAMQAAGEIVGRALVAVRDAAVPGATTQDLNDVAHEVITSAGAVPSFLGYEGFPASV